jgi:hypothetical protein
MTMYFFFLFLIQSLTAQSGSWTGYYIQYNKQFPFSMQLFLGNVDGLVKGEGKDSNGLFSVSGSWSKLDGSVQFIKQYVGAHAVTYDGRLSHRGGQIDGKYTVAGNTGEFHMEVS